MQYQIHNIKSICSIFISVEDGKVKPLSVATSIDIVLEDKIILVFASLYNFFSTWYTVKRFIDYPPAEKVSEEVEEVLMGAGIALGKTNRLEKYLLPALVINSLFSYFW